MEDLKLTIAQSGKGWPNYFGWFYSGKISLVIGDNSFTSSEIAVVRNNPEGLWCGSAPYIGSTNSSYVRWETIVSKTLINQLENNDIETREYGNNFSIFLKSDVIDIHADNISWTNSQGHNNYLVPCFSDIIFNTNQHNFK